MMVGRLALLALVVLAALGEPAGATVFPGSPPTNGPVMGGGAAVWADEGGYYEGVKSAVPDGSVRPMHGKPAADGERCARYVDLAASATRAAVIQATGPRTPGGCGELSDLQLLVGTHTAYGFSALDAGCPPSAIDLDGDLLAVACRGGSGALKVIDLSGITSPWEVEAPGAWFGVRLAGRYLAAATERSGSGPAEVRVIDRQTGQVAYRVGAESLTGENDLFRANTDLEVGADGTLLVSATRLAGATAPRLFRLSPAQPQPAEVTSDLDQVQFGFDGGGRIAVRRRDKADFAVLDLHGSELEVFGYHDGSRPGVSDIAFDGARAAYYFDGMNVVALPVDLGGAPGVVPLGGGSAPQRQISAAGQFTAMPAVFGAGAPLAVWTEGGSAFKVRRLARNGRPAGSARRLGATCSIPGPADAGSDERSGRHLLVWSSTCGREPLNARIFARVVARSGRPVGQAVELGRGYGPEVEFDGSTGRFLVAWSESNDVSAGKGEVAVRWVDARGRPLGRSERLTRLPDIQLLPQVALAKVRRGFLLAYTWGASIAVREVFALRLDRKGRRVGGPRRISAGGAEGSAASLQLDADAAGTRVLASWQGAVIGPLGPYWVRALSAAGKPLGPPRLLDRRGAGYVAAAPHGKGWLAAWPRRDEADVEIHATAISSSGAVSRKVFRVSEMGDPRHRVRAGQAQEMADWAGLTRVGRGRFVAVWAGTRDGSYFHAIYSRALRLR